MSDGPAFGFYVLEDHVILLPTRQVGFEELSGPVVYVQVVDILEELLMVYCIKCFTYVKTSHDSSFHGLLLVEAIGDVVGQLGKGEGFLKPC